MPFSVVTWNVLAQAYIKPGRYDHVPTAALQPEPRRQLLLEQIVAQDADIYCLQELEPDCLAAIEQALGGRYAVVYGQKRERPDGSAVLVRRDTASIVQHEILHFEAIEPGWDHLAVLALLQLGAHRLAVVSTHLRWQPARVPREQHLGRRQLLEILARREALLGDWPAWLIAGDFNALSESVVLQAALERGLRLSCRSQRPWDTVNIDGRRRKLDYLLYTPEHLAPAPGVLPRLERSTPMPSEIHPSDHLPVAVTYTWR